MKYEFSEDAESLLAGVGWTFVATSPLLLALEIEGSTFQLRLIVVVCMWLIACVALALVYHTHRWAQLVLTVTGINAVYGTWIRWRLRQSERRLNACQVAFQFFKDHERRCLNEGAYGDTRDLRRFYNELCEHVPGQSFLPEFEETLQNAARAMPGRETWVQMQLAAGAADAYEEGRFEAGSPNVRPYWASYIQGLLVQQLALTREQVAAFQQLLSAP